MKVESLKSDKLNIMFLKFKIAERSILGLFLLILAVFSFSCEPNEKVEPAKIESKKILFDAISLFGKSSVEVNKVLGSPNYHEMWEYNGTQYFRNWYTIEEATMVRFKKDSDNDAAEIFQVNFENGRESSPKTLAEAAALLGMDLPELKPTYFRESKSSREEIYNNLPIRGKTVAIYYFKGSDGWVSLKVHLGGGSTYGPF